MIDLLLGGSPCQGFSFAGKQLNFFDPRSKLFFDYVKALETLKPRYFLLENVKMKQEYQDVISKCLGVEPIMINSSLLSAQSRERNYWTNIPGITQPEDKGIVMSQILESGIACNFEKQGKYIKKINVDKSLCLLARYYKGFGNQQMTGVVEVGKAEDINGHDFLKRIYSPYGKSPTLTAVCGGNQERKIAVSETEYRMLTPLEYERLQTLPDNYTEGLSNTQRYKALCNGWTADVIAHILSFIPETHLHTVVSLFDGISCGQVALERAGKIYNQYYASEIDKYAIQVTQKNYSHTMQLGDITQIDWDVFKDRLNMIQKVS